jgi:hypothetical protein
MKDGTSDKPDLPKQSVSSPLVQTHIGRLRVDPVSGKMMVQCAGSEPREARILSNINKNELVRVSAEDREVIVVFAHEKPEEPVIIGIIENVLEELVCMEEAPHETFVDGERVVIRAGEEISLTCGEGSITINKSGKIVVRGTDILSRASGINKIKGSGIEFN